MTERALSRVGQTGVIFELKATRLNDAGTALVDFDLTGSAAVIEFFREDKTKFTKTGVVSNVSSEWFVTYTDPTSSSILDKPGYWQMRIIATLADTSIVPCSLVGFYVGQ